MTAELRPVMISLLRDRSSRVRNTALRALAKSRLAPSEAPAIEALLTRSATDTRRGALTLLASMPGAAARESAARLAASKDKRQRDAGADPSPAAVAGMSCIKPAAPLYEMAHGCQPDSCSIRARTKSTGTR